MKLVMFFSALIRKVKGIDHVICHWGLCCFKKLRFITVVKQNSKYKCKYKYKYKCEPPKHASQKRNQFKYASIGARSFLVCRRRRQTTSYLNWLSVNK